jgi:putative ABC transport system substrate-binding protein
MRRRDFFGLMSGAAAAWPFAARAQQSGKIARISIFGPDARKTSFFGTLYQAFFTRLQDLGFREGQNLTVTFGAVDDPRGLSVVAAELVRSPPDLIVVSGSEDMLQAVLALNRGIPIVVIAVNFDPIARGYVASLTRPGGNITGVVFQQLELAQKQVELLMQTFPGKTRLAALYDAQTADQFNAAERNAISLNLQIHGKSHRMISMPRSGAWWRPERRWCSCSPVPFSLHIRPGSANWQKRTVCPQCS